MFVRAFLGLVAVAVVAESGGLFRGGCLRDDFEEAVVLARGLGEELALEGSARGDVLPILHAGAEGAVRHKVSAELEPEPETDSGLGAPAR